MDNAIDILIQSNENLQQLSENGTLPANILSSLFDTTVQPYLSDVKNQVHIDGVEGEAYSTKEAWYSRDQFFKKGAFKSVGKKGTPTKSTMYFMDGYKGLREEQSYPTDKVYLEVSGALRNSYQADQVEGEWNLGIVDIEQLKKYTGLNTRYGEFYHGNEQSVSRLNERTVNEINRIVLNASNDS